MNNNTEKKDERKEMENMCKHIAKNTLEDLKKDPERSLVATVVTFQEGNRMDNFVFSGKDPEDGSCVLEIFLKDLHPEVILIKNYIS